MGTAEAQEAAKLKNGSEVEYLPFKEKPLQGFPFGGRGLVIKEDIPEIQQFLQYCFNSCLLNSNPTQHTKFKCIQYDSIFARLFELI